MYICICRGITDKDIERAFKAKSGNIKEALSMLGVGSDCGTCLETAFEELVQTTPHLFHNINKNSLKKPA